MLAKRILSNWLKSKGHSGKFPCFTPFSGTAVGSCEREDEPVPGGAYICWMAAEASKGPSRGQTSPDTGTTEIHIPNVHVAEPWTTWGGQTAACHHCPQRGGTEGDAWAVPGVRSERSRDWGSEANSGTGVHQQSARGRVTSPAWVQMALHMALLLPEPCLLRQHLRSRQALAETLQTSLSPNSRLDLEGQWVCKWQAALPQAGESYLVTFQKTVPISLCPGMSDLPAPGKIKKKQSKTQ